MIFMLYDQTFITEEHIHIPQGEPSQRTERSAKTNKKRKLNLEKVDKENQQFSQSEEKRMEALRMGCNILAYCFTNSF